MAATDELPSFMMPQYANTVVVASRVMRSDQSAADIQHYAVYSHTTGVSVWLKEDFFAEGSQLQQTASESGVGPYTRRVDISSMMPGLWRDLSATQRDSVQQYYASAIDAADTLCARLMSGQVTGAAGQPDASAVTDPTTIARCAAADNPGAAVAVVSGGQKNAPVSVKLQPGSPAVTRLPTDATDTANAAVVTGSDTKVRLPSVTSADSGSTESQLQELLLHVRAISDHTIREGTPAWDSMFPGSLVSEWQPQESKYLFPGALVWAWPEEEASRRSQDTKLSAWQKHMPLLPMFTCTVAGDGNCVLHSTLLQVSSEQSGHSGVEQARDAVLQASRVPWSGRLINDEKQRDAVHKAMLQYRSV